MFSDITDSIKSFVSENKKSIAVIGGIVTIAVVAYSVVRGLDEPPIDIEKLLK